MSLTARLLTSSTAYPFLHRQASLAACPSLRGLHSFAMNCLHRVAATLGNLRAGRTTRKNFRKTAARVRASGHNGTEAGAKCAWALRGIPVSLLLAILGYGQDAQAQTRCAIAPPNTTCGLVVTPGGDGYNFISGQTEARVYVLDPLLSIYMDNRGLLGTPDPNGVWHQHD